MIFDSILNFLYYILLKFYYMLVFKIKIFGIDTDRPAPGEHRQGDGAPGPGWRSTSDGARDPARAGRSVFPPRRRRQPPSLSWFATSRAPPPGGG